MEKVTDTMVISSLVGQSSAATGRRSEEGAKGQTRETSWEIVSTPALVSLLDLLHIVVQDVAEVLPPNLGDEDGVAEVALHL